MLNFISIIGALLVLCFIVFFHELGHYGAARLLGVKVEEFAIGFGPKLLSTVRNGIRYSIRAFPLGGFCAFKGEDKDAPDDPDSFNLQKPYKHFLTILAGPVLNLLVAFLLAVATLSIYGDYQATIVSVEPGTPASKTALQPNDVLIAVNGKPLQFAFEATNAIISSDPATIEITVKRGKEELTITAHDIYNTQEGHNLLGVQLSYSTRKTFTFGESIGAAFGFMGFVLTETVKSIGSAIANHNIGDQVMGPVGTISLISEAVRTSLEGVLRIAMLISFSLGLLNLVPFPGLDGSRLVFIGYEKIAGKPVPRDKEGMIHFVGFAILIALSIFVLFKDVGRIFGGPG